MTLEPFYSKVYINHLQILWPHCVSPKSGYPFYEEVLGMLQKGEWPSNGIDDKPRERDFSSEEEDMEKAKAESKVEGAHGVIKQDKRSWNSHMITLFKKDNNVWWAFIESKNSFSWDILHHIWCNGVNE